MANQEKEIADIMDTHTERIEERTDDGRLIIRVGDITLIETAPTNWRAASTGMGYVDVPRPGRLRRAQSLDHPVPQGLIHAYELGADMTACDEPLAGLYPWEDQPFSDRLLNRCRTCLERTRGADELRPQ